MYVSMSVPSYKIKEIESLRPFHSNETLFSSKLILLSIETESFPCFK